VSCADGTNVVRVFKEAISLAIKNKEHPPDEVLASHLQRIDQDKATSFNTAQPPSHLTGFHTKQSWLLHTSSSTIGEGW
jgi:hypothetical protein